MRRGTLLAIVTLLALPGLAKIKTQIGKDAIFSRYRTYEWLPTRVLRNTGLVDDDPVVSPVIRAAVDKELARLGLVPAETGRGDLQIATLALRESIPQLEAFIYPGGLEWGFGDPIATIGRYNNEGTLVINLIDTASQKSAWAAMAKETFDKPEQLEAKINKAVAAMFKKYPKRQ